MKPVSFSLGVSSEPARDKSKKVHDVIEGTVKESITEFSVRDPKAKAREERRVIPSKPNHLTSKKQKDDVDPNALGSMQERFEKAAVQQTVGDGVYGLVSSKTEPSHQPPEHTRGAQKVTMSSITDDLPDEPTTEYEDMPVDQFASALLRGMGLTKNHVVPTVELVARPSRMGLGAKVGDMSTLPTQLMRVCCEPVLNHLALTAEHARADTNKRTYKELVGADGSAKSIIRQGDQVIDKATLGPKVGKQMTVAEGRHSGLQCIVRALNVGGNEDAVRVTLLPSEKDAVVDYSCLTEPGMRPRSTAEASQQPHSVTNGSSSRHGRSSDAQEDRRSGTAHASAGLAGDRSSKRAQRAGAAQEAHNPGASARYNAGANGSRGVAGGNSHGRHAERDGDRGRSDKSHEVRRRKSWLREGVRVRVVSQTLNRGKAYLSKAVIMNVLGHAHCSIKLDSGPVLDDVYEEDLETVVSKSAGAALMIVRGCHSGEHARLLEKTKKGAAVQLVDSGEAVQLSLDDIADYLGADVEHW